MCERPLMNKTQRVVLLSVNLIRWVSEWTGDSKTSSWSLTLLAQAIFETTAQIMFWRENVPFYIVKRKQKTAIWPTRRPSRNFQNGKLLGGLLEYYVQSLKIIPKAKKNFRQQRQWVHFATVHKELLKLETPKGSRSLELQVCNCASSRQVPNQAALIRSRLFRIHSAAHVNWQRLVNCIAAATPLFKDPNANKILPEARGLII